MTRSLDSANRAPLLRLGPGRPASSRPASKASRPERARFPRLLPALAAAAAWSAGLLAAAGPAAAQPRPLDHDDVLRWNRIASSSLSPDGAWMTFVLAAMEGDPSLSVRAAREGSPMLVVRGTNPVFTSDSRFLVYEAPPTEAVTDSLKREGKKGDDLPGDSLVVARLAAVFAGGEPALDGIRTLGAIESRKVASDGAWVAFVPVEEEKDEDKAADEEETEPEKPGPEKPEAGAPEEEAADEETPRKEKPAGSPLVLVELATGEETRYEDVVDYFFAEEAPVLVFSTSTEDGTGDGAFVVNLADGARFALLEGEGRYKRLALAKDGSRAAFLSDRDDYEAEQAEFVLYQASAPDWEAAAVAGSATEGVPEGWWVSEHGAVRFSEGGSRLRFGTAPRPEPEPDEDEEPLEEDEVVLDVWNWKDPYLQPMQLVQAPQERNRTYAAVAPVDGGTVVQLGSPDVPAIRFAAEGDADYAVGVTDMPYRQLLSWDGRYNDVYAVDLATGARRRIAQQVKGFGGASVSPAGRYAAWWDGVQRHWMAASLDGGAAVSASGEVPHPVWNELDDHPDLPPPYGFAGWTEDDGAFLFYDRYDVWAFDPATGDLANLTGGAGREAGLRFRYARTEPELDHIPAGDALWEAFHYQSKRSGFFRGRTDRPAEPAEVVMADKRFRLRGKAEDADRWLLSREDFREYPDLWVTDGSITDMARMSDANPQQSNYVWGSAEIVEWTSNDGLPLQGILFKPDDFDASRKHPMMVYFYERMSDGVHAHRSPVPGGSSVSVPFYVSRGYVVFIPDIPYEIGYPGESALDAVVPGVLRVLAEGFVDKDRVGVQGHSWGGYQIAYMITKTHLFAAAEAGAPVSNMTSAYGGIRWQSGMSRMFQYERTQSRIGGTLWESTNEYLHNSPVFYADKIETPLLMMHNDEDGAVPWYQGIEMFVAMRRLQKPVWMLNYNGEAHGLRKEPNRKDWAVRMQQFFDHYLKDAPAPVWMEDGIPAVDKGKTLGTDLKGAPKKGIS